MDYSHMKKLAPGAYADDQGAVHFDVGEVLEYFGLPDTPEQQEHATAMIAEVASQLLPATPVNVLHEPKR